MFPRSPRKSDPVERQLVLDNFTRATSLELVVPFHPFAVATNYMYVRVLLLLLLL